jgi:hypothetical protein
LRLNPHLHVVFLDGAPYEDAAVLESPTRPTRYGRLILEEHPITQKGTPLVEHLLSAYFGPTVSDPYYPIDQVTRLARDDQGTAWISGRSAFDPVIDKLDLTLTAARTEILSRISQLTLDDFAHQNHERTPPADVYGVTHQGFGWYVKLKLQPATILRILSFHPPERHLRTRSGTISR